MLKHRQLTMNALLLSSSLTLTACLSTPSSPTPPAPPTPPSAPSSPSSSSPSSMPQSTPSRPSSPSKPSANMPSSSPASSSSSQGSPQQQSQSPAQQSTDGSDAGGPSQSQPNSGEQSSASNDQGGEDQGGASASQQDPTTTEQASQSGEDSEFETQDIISQPNQAQSDDIDFSEEDPSSSASSTQTDASAQAQADASSASSSAANSASANSGSSASQAGGATTEAEKIEAMDEKLESSMSDYDGMILQEREYVQNRENEKGSMEEVAKVDREDLYDEVGSGDENGGGVYGEEAATQQVKSNSTGNSTSGTDTGPYDMEATKRDGQYKHDNPSNKPPADIPSGQDDDVVARQIREAAMNEPDPKLREKLWQEYRKYKNQSGGK